MAKTKTSSGFSVSGGKTRMFGKMGVQPSQPGVSAPSRAPAMTKNPPKGGRTGVMGKQGGVLNAVPGQVTPAKSGVGNSKGFSVSGGKKHMFGKQTASTARPA